MNREFVNQINQTWKKYSENGFPENSFEMYMIMRDRNGSGDIQAEIFERTYREISALLAGYADELPKEIDSLPSVTTVIRQQSTDGSWGGEGAIKVLSRCMEDRNIEDPQML